ncbi:MAG: lysophospholipid acyltransferase family protein [Candidatus Omnitrophica bacterium]|nr:lysophospholipid acyltransferase family protein [Candidatus Omnitrophota bacterium]
MVNYFLYRIAKFLAIILPRKISYSLASFLAQLRFYFSPRDRKAVIYNIKRVVGQSSEKDIRQISKKVFINFGKYLVDFFRFSKLDEGFIKKYVKIRNLNYLDEALSQFSGAIALTAHLGNWELGGAIVGKLGYPLYVIALPHQNPKVNRFFDSQRNLCGVEVIPVGLALRKCFRILKNKKIIALLGDRDFGKDGLSLKFCTRLASIPQGAAVFSIKTKVPVIPAFFIRNLDDTFSLIFEKPILPFDSQGRLRDKEKLLKEYVRIIEDYVRRYPEQWYMFQPFFKE